MALTLSPESFHNKDSASQVQNLHAPGAAPAAYSGSESQLNAQDKTNLGIQTQQGSLRQAAGMSSQVQLLSASSQPPSCHSLDTSIATDTEQMVPVQAQAAAAAAAAAADDDDDDDAKQDSSLQAPPALHTITQQADIHPSAVLHHPQHAQQEQAVKVLEAQHAQQGSAATVAPHQLVSLPDAQQTRQDHEEQKQDAVQQPAESSMERAQDNQQLPDAANATIGQPNQQLNAKHVVQSQDTQPATSQQRTQAQQAQQPPEAQQASEAQQAQHACSAAAQEECNDGLDNVWQADRLQPDADTVMSEAGHAEQNDASGPFETQHAQRGCHTNPQQAHHSQQHEAGFLFEAQHAQQAPDSIMIEAQSDSAVHEAQHAQQGGVSFDAERSNVQPKPAGVQHPQGFKVQVEGHAEVRTDQSAKIGLQPA